MSAHGRQCPLVPNPVPVSYPRRCPPPVQATEHPGLQGVFSSPLADSNRRPPPYHGGFAPLLCDLGKRLVARFPCNSAGLSACSTLSSKDPEPPRVAANLSPEPSPKEARTCSRRGQRASVARDSAQASVVRSGWRRIADAKLALRADRSEESLR
jgi:hypothetical protein